MLNTPPQSSASGFTLIELMITIAIFSVTVTLGVSSYRTWVLNTQIRTAAESIQNGMQRARAEAVKCNANIAFTLVADSSWTISYVSACGDIPAGNVLESRSGKEGSKNASVTVTPEGATTVTFSPLGRVTPNSPVSDTLTQVDVDSASLDAADSRELRIMLNATSGSVRMCDPNPDVTGPRAC